MVALNACTSSNKEQQKPTGPIIYALQDDFDTLDPQTSVGGSMSYTTQFLLYDRLLALDSNNKVIPYLAKSWTVSPDSTSVTLTLVKGATCSDGTPITPDVVAASLRRMAAPSTKGPYSYRTVGLGGLKSVTTDDAAGTVTETLNKPNSDILIGLTAPWAAIVCPAGISNPDSLKNQAAGSGPYTLVDSKRGDSYTLKARSGYDWGANGATTSRPDFPKTLILRVVRNSTTTANLLLADQINIGYIVGRDLNRVKADTSLFHLKTTTYGYGANALMFNEAPGLPGADLTVRRALAMAVDPTAWNQASTFGQGEVQHTLFTANMNCDDSSVASSAAPYSPADARQLLQQAGWSPGSDGIMTKGGKELSVRIVGYDQQNAGPEYLQSAFKAIGVKAILQDADFNTWVSVLFETGKWDVTVYVFGSPFASPSIFTGQLGFAHVDNKEHLALANEAVAAPPDQACALWTQAQKPLLENVDVKPVNATVSDYFGNGISFSIASAYIDPFSLKVGT